MAFIRSGHMVLKVEGRGYALAYYTGLTEEVPHEHSFPDRGGEVMCHMNIAKAEGGADMREAVIASVRDPLSEGKPVVLVGTGRYPRTNTEVAVFAGVT